MRWGLLAVFLGALGVWWVYTEHDGDREAPFAKRLR